MQTWDGLFFYLNDERISCLTGSQLFVLDFLTYSRLRLILLKIVADKFWITTVHHVLQSPRKFWLLVNSWLIMFIEVIVSTIVLLEFFLGWAVSLHNALLGMESQLVQHWRVIK